MNFILLAYEYSDTERLEEFLRTNYLVVINVIARVWILQTSDDALTVMSKAEEFLQDSNGIAVKIDADIVLTNSVSPEMLKLLFNK
jgi:hypothetical protein